MIFAAAFATVAVLLLMITPTMPNYEHQQCVLVSSAMSFIFGTIAADSAGLFGVGQILLIGILACFLMLVWMTVQAYRTPD
jgi:hypothetical protein